MFERCAAARNLANDRSNVSLLRFVTEILDQCTLQRGCPTKRNSEKARCWLASNREGYPWGKPTKFPNADIPPKIPYLYYIMLYLLIEMYTSSYFSPCISIDVTQFEGPKTYDTP